MPLEAGTKLGQYEILSSLGAGGMGEVYRARDRSLDREVAVKVLPEDFARDSARVARFEREAKSLAALNHPNIATVHGFESQEDTSFLVMELIEGEELADRVRHGPLALDEAIPIFVQIAEGLEAAHAAGIIHRDLKPANVKVTEEGRVKILDFGLAKATTPELPADGDLSQSPTLTAAATARGEIMGTAAYMSPEQAQGRTVDQRADIWAFGVCLFEALSGERPFKGDIPALVLASVLKEEPPWDRLPRAVPASLVKLMRRCLAKKRQHRLQAIGDARLELTDPTPVEESAREVESRRPVALIVAALAAGVVLGAGLLVWLRPSAPPLPDEKVVRFAMQLPAEERLWVETNAQVLHLSRGAETLLYVGDVGGRRRLFVRPLSAVQPRVLDTPPFGWGMILSPDGEWVATMGPEGLFKVPTGGGLPISVFKTQYQDFFSGAWLSGGRLAFAKSGRGLVLLDEDGQREPEALTSLDRERGEIGHDNPVELPGDRGFLITVYVNTLDNYHVDVLDGETGERRPLLENTSKAFYVDGGFIVFGRGDTLFTVPFDLERLELAGPETPVLSGVARETFWNRIPLFAVSQSGTLVYVPDGQGLAATRLAWLDRDGTTEPLPLQGGTHSTAQLSPDGRVIALDRREGDRLSLAKYDIARDQLTELTAVGTFNTLPVWHPDGEHVAITSNRPLTEGAASGPWAIHLVALATGEAELVQESLVNQQPGSWSRDGEFFTYLDGLDQGDLWVRRWDAPTSSAVRVESPAEAHAATPTFSPDGRHIAYLQRQNHREEIFIAEFDPDQVAVGRREKASKEGGVEPVWSRDGHELFYRSLDGKRLLKVDVGSGDGIDLGPETFVVETPTIPPPNVWGSRKYDVTADGRFLIVEGTGLDQPMELVVVYNWVEELRDLFGRERE